jgi:hypothetical protein
MTYPYMPALGQGGRPAFPVTVAQTGDQWIVTVGPTTYPCVDEAAATAFATAAARSLAAYDWYVGAKATLSQFETMLAEAGRLKMLYEDSKLYELVLATPAGATVPGMGVSVIRSIEVGSLMQDLFLFLSQATVGDPPAGLPMQTRRAVITSRD